MPSKSKKQHNFMEAIAHNPAFAKKVGVSQKVGQEYSKADKGKTFRKGGIMDKKDMHSEKSEMKMDKEQDKAMIKKAFKQHDLQEHKGGKGTSLKLKKGGMSAGCGYDKGGKVKKFAAGGTVKKYGFGGLLSGFMNNIGGPTTATAGQPVADARLKPGGVPLMGDTMPKYGNGGGAQGGLDQVNQGSSQIGQSLGTIAGALGTGGGQGPSLGPNVLFKKGGRVKKMAMGGTPMMPPVDPRMAMMAKKKAPRGVAPARGMMPPAAAPRGMMSPAAPQVAPTMPMKKGGKVKGQSPIQTKAKGGAKIVKMAKGGLTSSRGDGCAIRGKTRA